MADVSTNNYDALKNLFVSLDEEEWEQRKFQKVSISPYSETVWTISPPALSGLVQSLSNNNVQILITLEWTFVRYHCVIMSRNFPSGSNVATGQKTSTINDPRMTENLRKLVTNFTDTNNNNDIVIRGNNTVITIFRPIP